jgi:hypothetical protein
MQVVRCCSTLDEQADTRFTRERLGDRRRRSGNDLPLQGSGLQFSDRQDRLSAHIRAGVAIDCRPAPAKRRVAARRRPDCGEAVVMGVLLRQGPATPFPVLPRNCCSASSSAWSAWSHSRRPRGGGHARGRCAAHGLRPLLSHVSMALKSALFPLATMKLILGT